MTKRDQAQIPEGKQFLELIDTIERDCENQSVSSLTQLGAKAPRCLEELATILSLLDRLSSCFWGCKGGDHVIEYLTGRSVSLARAALRLLNVGYYDEALVLVRSLGEIANLLSLFVNDEKSFHVWRQASRKERIGGFAPAAVRGKLAKLNAPQPVSADRYSALCEVAAHVTPETRPQGYNALLMPGGGGNYSRISFLLVLNELAVPSTFIGLFASALLQIPKEIQTRFASVGRAVAESIGSVNLIDGYPRLNDETLQELQSLLQEVPEGDRSIARQALFHLADMGPPAEKPKDQT